jgi:hypothetical protein
MAKFINKKEQVYDFQLTTYGRKMLSVGSFRPTYYAFFDDNIVYDTKYIGRHGPDATGFTYTGDAVIQNSIHERIKNETHYLEGLTLFQDLESTLNNNMGRSVNFFNLNDMEDKFEPAKDIYKLDNVIGDAFLDGDSQTAPAWKVAALQSKITSSPTKDTTNDTNIPQINIDANYVLRVAPRDDWTEAPNSARSIIHTTPDFIDDNVIILEGQDPLLYLEEVNTLILNDNFEIEVFVRTAEDASRLERKYFSKADPQVKDGLMTRPIDIEEDLNNPTESNRWWESGPYAFTTNDVEYYFDVLADSEVDQNIACKGAEIFNKQSLYIDLDFDCDIDGDERVFFDIYGVVTEPEICLD